jgi:hypothetical protein
MHGVRLTFEEDTSIHALRGSLFFFAGGAWRCVYDVWGDEEIVEISEKQLGCRWRQ